MPTWILGLFSGTAAKVLGIALGAMALVAAYFYVQSLRSDLAATSAALERAQKDLAAERRNTAVTSGLIRQHQENEERKAPVVQEVIRNVYRERIVEPESCPGTVAPARDALDGLRRLRSSGAANP